MVTAQDALRLYWALSAQGMRLWLTGGWGIDALFGEQTRPHKDLDILMLLEDVRRLLDYLAGEGYILKELWSENIWQLNGMGEPIPTAFVLHDAAGRELDAHALQLDEQGNGIPAWDAPEGFIFKREDLAGRGMIAGYAVNCLTPAMQMACHTGYTLPEVQRGDLERLAAKFGVRLPAEDAHSASE